VVVVDASAERLPAPWHRLAARLNLIGAIGFVRSHIAAFAAGAGLTAGLLITTAEALGEGWTSPLLVLTGTAIGAGGFFAFCLVCNTTLQITVPRDTATTTRQGTPRTWRSAIRVATLAGSLAMPTSAVLRDGIWAALGREGQIDTPEQLAVIIFTSALVAAGLAFCASLVVTGSTRRRHGRLTR
jgi:hypothetical protein